MGTFIDMTGKTYNNWYVIEKDTNIKSKEIKWKCKCLLCGTEKSVRGTDIRNGKSKNCGCVRSQKTSQRNVQGAKNIQGKIYGYLQAIEPTEKRQNTYVIWKCKCLKCGKIIESCLHDLEKGSVQSCGCMSESHGELAIKQLLKEYNIEFTTEKTFPTCRFSETNACARFDFYVDNQYLIEFDGSQHYSPMTYNNCGWNTQERFEKTKKNDIYKNNWCKENNIPLIRIPYTRLKNLCIEDLKLETSTFIIEKI
jgi:hypothetical protein